jgi:ABC-type phosphate/phosphonate transport system substrate-binding protein
MIAAAPRLPGRGGVGRTWAFGAFLLLVFRSCGLYAGDPAPERPFHVTLAFSNQIFVDVESTEAQSALKVLTAEILERNFPGGASESFIVSGDSSLRKTLVEGKADMVGMTSDEYLRLRNQVVMEPAFTSTNGRDPFHQVVLLVRRDAGIRNLAGLRGKRLTLSTDQAKTIHLTWLETLLMKEGVREVRDFFSAVKEGRSPSAAVLPVFFQQADACLTTQQAFDVVRELNPQIGADLAVLARSQDITSGVIVYRPDFDVLMKEKISRFLDGLEKDPRGLQVLKMFRMSKLLRWQPGYARTLEALLAEHDSLNKSLAGRK